MRDKSQVVLPLNLGICIPEGDFVFKVAEICEELDYTELYNTYVRKWRKVNPITLFEILVFGYMEHLYSGRDIEKACKTDIRFMWLLNGEPAPSHATISRFQDERLSEVMEGLFYQFVEKLYEMGEVKFKNFFIDGTKIEAYANKYTFVWKKAVEKNLAKLEKKIETVLPTIANRYGINTSASLEECYEALVLHAQWIKLTFVKGTGKHKSGTVVLWENFDLIEKSSGNVYAELSRLQDSTAEYLSLIFHRYLNREGSAKIVIKVNNYTLKGLDPFLENHKKTNVRRRIEIPILDSKGVERYVSVQPYVLPFQKDLTPDDKKLSGGIENYRSKQGFYIYRNERLIIWGTWFGRHRDELTKYARVKVC